MKILLDTNVLISAFIFGGKASILLSKLFDSDHELYILEYVDREFKETMETKWPDKATKVYSLFHTMAFDFCKSTDQKLGKLRDQKDIPVLSDVLFHDVDLILTGDKDFLEADLTRPLVYSPSMMLVYMSTQN